MINLLSNVARTLAPAKPVSLHQQKATFADIQASRVLPGQEIGPGWQQRVYGEYAIKSVPAYRAITLRAEAVAATPLLVYQRQSDGTSEQVPSEHPFQQLLDRFNHWWTQADGLYATEAMLALWGAAFWWLEHTGGPRTPIKAIWPLHPDRVRIIAGQRRGMPSEDSYIAGFEFQGEAGGTVPLGREEVVWFRRWNPLDEYAGLAPTAVARLSLDMGRDALTFNRNLFANSAMPQDLIFFANGPLTEDEVNDFYARLSKRHQGAGKANRPLIWDLSSGGKPERLGLTQRDMEFTAGLNWTVEDAARAWGVPPPKMYSQTASIYNNVKQADIEFETGTVTYERTFIENEINEMLAPLFGPDLYVKFDTSGVLALQEALAELHDRDRLDVGVGISTINEVRSRRGMADVPWGDTYWVPLSLIPATSPGGSPTMEQAAMRSGYVTRALSDAHLTRLEEAHVKRLDRHEVSFRELQLGLFNEQKRDILRRLKSSDQRALTRQITAGGLFDADAWNERFAASGQATYQSILIAGAEGQNVEFGLGVAFNVEAPPVKEWLLNRRLFWASRVNQETAQLLAAELNEAIGAGESITQIAARVEKVFEFNSQIRAERIARTETLAAINNGHMQLYHQSGVVGRKQWLAVGDDRTRPDHMQAHIDYGPRTNGIPLDAPFIVGGAMMQQPGDGPVEQIVNCRCESLPVIGRA